MKLVSKDPAQDPVSFVVDHIVAHRGSPSNRQYLIRWKGQGASSDSWEPHTNFDDEQVLRDYWQRLSSSPGSSLEEGNVVTDTITPNPKVGLETQEAAPPKIDEEAARAAYRTCDWSRFDATSSEGPLLLAGLVRFSSPSSCDLPCPFRSGS